MFIEVIQWLYLGVLLYMVNDRLWEIVYNKYLYVENFLLKPSTFFKIIIFLRNIQMRLV